MAEQMESKLYEEMRNPAVREVEIMLVKRVLDEGILLPEYYTVEYKQKLAERSFMRRVRALEESTVMDIIFGTLADLHQLWVTRGAEKFFFDGVRDRFFFDGAMERRCLYLPLELIGFEAATVDWPMLKKQLKPIDLDRPEMQMRNVYIARTVRFLREHYVETQSLLIDSLRRGEVAKWIRLPPMVAREMQMPSVAKAIAAQVAEKMQECEIVFPEE